MTSSLADAKRHISSSQGGAMTTNTAVLFLVVIPHSLVEVFHMLFPIAE
jgi:hypothetical protein